MREIFFKGSARLPILPSSPLLLSKERDLRRRIAAVRGIPSLSASGSASRRGNSRRTPWPAHRLRTGGGLIVGRRGSLARAFLSLQPGLHRVFGEETPAPNSNAPWQVLSPGELVANGSGLETQRVGELLDCVQRPHDGLSDSGLGPQSLPR